MATFPVLTLLLVTLSSWTHFTEALPIVATFSLTSFSNGFDYRAKNQLVLDNATGFVYAGVGKWILQFDADLNLVASAESVPKNFDIGCESCRQIQHFAINRDYQELLACTSREEYQQYGYVKSICSGWNLTNLSRIQRNYDSITDPGRTPPFAFVAPGPSENVLYVMSDSKLAIRKTPMFATRSLVPDDNLKLTSSANLHYETEGTWLPVYGFSHKGFSYFLAAGYNGRFVSKLIRVCQNHSNLTLYADIEMECGEMSVETSSADVATAAYIRTPGSAHADQLNVTTKDQVLFVLFQPLGQFSGDYSKLCVYSMGKIQEAFKDNAHASSLLYGRDAKTNVTQFEDDFCRKASEPIRGSIPLKSDPAITLEKRATTVTATSSGDSTVVFIGSKEGQLKKFLLNNRTTAIEYPEKTKLDGRIDEIVFDAEEKHLYVMHGGGLTVSKILLRNSGEKERLEGTSSEKTFPLYGHSKDLDATWLTWCNDADDCTLATSDDVIDVAVNSFGSYGIRMNPPRIDFFKSGTSSTLLNVTRLPETISMRHARWAIIRADPSENQVLWMHAQAGHLWLTNVGTGASVPLKKDFDVVDMDVDWENGIVFGVSAKDRKCIFKLDLKYPSSVTRVFVDEAVKSMAVGKDSLIYYVTESGKIVQRNQAGSELEVFRSHQSSVPKSLVVRSNSELAWVQDDFGNVSVIYTLRKNRISTYKFKQVARGVRQKVGSEPESQCSNCSHFCSPAGGLVRSCGCHWGLQLHNGSTSCSGKWIHVVSSNSSTTDLVTYDLSNTAQQRRQRASLGTDRVKMIPQGGAADIPCFVTSNGTGNVDLLCGETAKHISIEFNSVLEVLLNPMTAAFDILFVNGSCIQILHVEKNETWTLYCGRISLTNVAVDTKSWTVFWEHNKEKNVHMTELDSMVTRRIINAATFELQTEVPNRLALDSNSKVLYWIHGSKIWSRSYSEFADSKPKLLWDTGNPKQLQFHEGFLYWIDSKYGDSDEIVIFDVEHESRETLITGQRNEFLSFAVQSVAPSLTHPTSSKCSECSHFCKESSRTGTQAKCWCPYEKPILASNGTCNEPVLHVVLEPETPKRFNVANNTDKNATGNTSTVAPDKTTVSSISRNVQCWPKTHQDSQPQAKCSVSNASGNKTKTFMGSALRTTSLLNSAADLQVYKTGSETAKYGCLTLENLKTGENIEFEQTQQDQGSPFAFDHRRKLAVWCTDRKVKLHSVSESHLDSLESRIERDFDYRTFKPCTSFTLDVENGQAFFIRGQQIKRLNYIAKSATPAVTTLHVMQYSYANSLSFDGNGHLFWAGGFVDFGEFVEMIKVPENPGEIVASIRVLNAGRNQIAQVRAERKTSENSTEKAANSEDSCDITKCEDFCFPASQVEKFVLIRMSEAIELFNALDVFAGVPQQFLFDSAGQHLYTTMSSEQIESTPSTVESEPSTSECPPPPTCPLIERPQVVTEWVDTDTDLGKVNWSTSNNLKYASSTYELPCPLNSTLRNLHPANGLFYFRVGTNGTVQFQKIVSRFRSVKSGEANLYIRYYVHHTSSEADINHRYFVSPVKGKFMGVQYLDARSNLKWKEAVLHLQVGDSEFSFQIGTTDSDDGDSIFVIDEIIFSQRSK